VSAVVHTWGAGLVAGKKVAVSWSGGKDGCLACYEAARQGHEIASLYNTISDEYRRVRFHGTEERLLRLQAEATGIALTQIATSGDGYEQEFKAGLRQLMDHGITGMVFGDVHLPDSREWVEKVCEELSLEPILPLFGRDTDEVLGSFIDAGFQALVVCAQGDRLGKEWVGRVVDSEFLSEISLLDGVDSCGENGEYHTFVIDGPIFHYRVEITDHTTVNRNGYWLMDTRSYRLEAKEPT